MRKLLLSMALLLVQAPAFATANLDNQILTPNLGASGITDFCEKDFLINEQEKPVEPVAKPKKHPGVLDYENVKTITYVQTIKHSMTDKVLSALLAHKISEYAIVENQDGSLHRVSMKRALRFFSELQPGQLAKMHAKMIEW